MDLAPLLVDELLGTMQKNNRRGVTLLLFEQNVNRALTISTRCDVLELGQVGLCGTGKDLLANERVKTAYMDYRKLEFLSIRAPFAGNSFQMALHSL